MDIRKEFRKQVNLKYNKEKHKKIQKIVTWISIVFNFGSSFLTAVTIALLAGGSIFGSLLGIVSLYFLSYRPVKSMRRDLKKER